MYLCTPISTTASPQPTNLPNPPNPPNPPMTDSTNVKDDLPNDSPLTLGQLKKIVKQLPSKQKQPQHDFGYADSDSLKNEIDELYNYLEMSQYLENEKIFQEGFDERKRLRPQCVISESWTKCTLSERRVYVEYLLEQLELKDAEKRLATARRLVYIAQGSFAEFSDTATHLHWITENNKVLRKSGALLSYNQALRLACTAHDLTSQIDPMAPQLADINREIDCHLTLLYMLVEVHRGDEKFGDELSRLDPPLAVSLFGLVAQLREKNVKTFPVKKVRRKLISLFLVNKDGIV
ncbi:N1221-like protein-domain-containing protein [Jimgerdemannia flammicorona]|uniref:N1221-like protein-domain-containing protein n=1 Tax=Jimgerdemannia flammicorona TaxID=994334 RepID=A0A433D286_9FUNG|nr:N1221-like protein-domain-containing protein [Jimgerdemannia flammicorona]